jgi:hypothetical protein
MSHDLAVSNAAGGGPTGKCASVVRSAARSYRPTSDFARMLVWISDVPPMMENARELR